jgi:hypothetical protein
MGEARSDGSEMRDKIAYSLAGKFNPNVEVERIP